MIEYISTIFLFLKDYAEEGHDRYFLFKGDALREVTAVDLVSFTGILVCHDYWLIAPSIYSSAGALPSCVVDLDEFAVATSPSRDERKQRDRKGISQALAETSKNTELASAYWKIFNKNADLDLSTYCDSGKWLFRYWKILIHRALVAGELARQIFVEIPVFNLLYQHTVAGICIDQDALREYKDEVDHEFYSALKRFSHRHNLALEVPSDLALIEYLGPLGFDFAGISIDYVLRLLPTPENFAGDGDALELRKLSASKSILAALPLSRDRSVPIVDVFGSITSRIYFKDPVFQNLARRYRNIIVASAGNALAYVDYDQFEVGIMAALSLDPQMLKLYSSSDIYTVLALEIFSDSEKRKIAKKLFLSYAYGMKIKSLVDAAVEQGGDRAKVKGFFAKFNVFEAWKKGIIERFEADGKIGTGFGNFQHKDVAGPITEKEKRAGVSQVVQGTASLIFKKALLGMRDENQVRILIPMHDAVLFEHPPGYDPVRVVSIFIQVMTEHLESRVVGKASLEPFYTAPSFVDIAEAAPPDKKLDPNFKNPAAVIISKPTQELLSF